MELTWIITGILGLLLIYVLYILSMDNMDYWKKRGVPFMKPLPFFGSMLEITLGQKGINEFSSEVYNKSEGEKYIGFMMFNNPVLLIRDIELINHVLIKDFNHFEDRTLPMDESQLINGGLQFITGNRWRVLRHKMISAFTSGKMKTMFKQINECSEELTSYLKVKNGEEIEVKSLSIKFILNVIGKISFGINVDALNEQIEPNNLFYQHSKRFFSPSMYVHLKFLVATYFPKVAQLLNMKLGDVKTDDFFRNLIRNLIKLRENDETKRNDFLQLLINQKKKEQSLISGLNNDELLEDNVQNTEEPEEELLEYLKNIKCDKTIAVFTDEIIVAQAFVFISGGTETAATVLSFALYQLAVNKHIQTRLQEEIDTVLSENGLTYEALKRMTYLDQVINEMLRYLPPGGTLMRVCTEEYTFPGTELTVEKGTFIQIPVLGIHRDPMYFPKPEKFDPDRFEDMEAIPKGTFYPFGEGPRICIGMRIALLEMKAFLATLLAHYSVFLGKKTKLPLVMNHAILPEVRGGMWIKFEPRNKS